MATMGTQKGFRVSCPRCGEDGCITLNVENVHVLTCTNCDEEMDAEGVRALIAGWSQLLMWLNTAPALDD